MGRVKLFFDESYSVQQSHDFDYAAYYGVDRKSYNGFQLDEQLFAKPIGLSKAVGCRGRKFAAFGFADVRGCTTALGGELVVVGFDRYGLWICICIRQVVHGKVKFVWLSMVSMIPVDDKINVQSARLV